MFLGRSWNVFAHMRLLLHTHIHPLGGVLERRTHHWILGCRQVYVCILRERRYTHKSKSAYVQLESQCFSMELRSFRQEKEMWPTDEDEKDISISYTSDFWVFFFSEEILKVVLKIGSLNRAEHVMMKKSCCFHPSCIKLMDILPGKHQMLFLPQ